MRPKSKSNVEHNVVRRSTRLAKKMDVSGKNSSDTTQSSGRHVSIPSEFSVPAKRKCVLKKESEMSNSNDSFNARICTRNNRSKATWNIQKNVIPSHIQKSAHSTKTANSESKGEKNKCWLGKSSTDMSQSIGRNISIQSEFPAPAKRKSFVKKDHGTFNSNGNLDTELCARNTRSETTLKIEKNVFSSPIQKSARLADRNNGAIETSASRSHVKEQRENFVQQYKKKCTALLKHYSFSIGEICFAKLNGHCTWPAKVLLYFKFDSNYYSIDEFSFFVLFFVFHKDYGHYGQIKHRESVFLWRLHHRTSE